MNFTNEHFVYPFLYKEGAGGGLIDEFSNFENHGLLYKVKYDKIPEPYDFLKMGKVNKSPFHFFYTKSPEWIYEEEYRLILNKEKILNQKVKFNKKILKKVIFGLDISQKNEIKIIEIISKNYLEKGLDVKFYKCKRKEDEYGVEIVDLNFH